MSVISTVLTDVEQAALVALRLIPEPFQGVAVQILEAIAQNPEGAPRAVEEIARQAALDRGLSALSKAELGKS